MYWCINDERNNGKAYKNNFFCFSNTNDNLDLSKFLLKGRSKKIIHKTVTTIIITVDKTTFFEISKDRNLITCISSFYFGMVLIKYKNFFLNKKVIFISFCINIFLYFKRIHSNFSLIISQLQGFTFLIVLICLGKIIMKSRLQTYFKEISRLSYCLFLFHHIIIMNVFSLNNPIIWYKIIFTLGVIIILSIIYSKILLIIIEFIYKSRAFIKIESYFVQN